MYGQIHCIVRELVTVKFGEATWATILEATKMDIYDDFLVFKRYDDDVTLNLISTTATVLNLTTETVLQVFGGYFLTYCLRHGYDKMLMTLGGDIVSFVSNLDSLHALLSMSYKSINAPSFRCVEHTEDMMILHYYSSRAGLHHIVIGLLEAVGNQLFDKNVKVTVQDQDILPTREGLVRYHTAFRVKISDPDSADKPSDEEFPAEPMETSSDRWLKEVKRKAFDRRRRSSVPLKGDRPLEIKAEDLTSAFPYHIVFDAMMYVKQCGVNIQRLVDVDVKEGMNLEEIATLVQPVMDLTIDNIFQFLNAVYVMSIDRIDDTKPLLLRGQMVWLKESGLMMFIASPRLTSLNELMDMNMYLSDIPIFDVTRDLILLNQQREAEIDVANKLDETTAELMKTSNALEAEKKKTETLLYQMMPKKIAQQMVRGETIKAEKHSKVTILFSDVVTFTNIASVCPPMEIVNMLNELYLRFDAAANNADVYKVETIGDAYMVVAGVPEKQPDHAKRVANFAMDMLEGSMEVNSPATKKPLQVRIGMHSGPIVTGVVGNKKPRYDLFGDTVNIASRMESHGAPGRIQCSDSSYQDLYQFGFIFKARGEIQVKGKGMMRTYFIIGNARRTLPEPDDEFVSLPVEAPEPTLDVNNSCKDLNLEAAQYDVNNSSAADEVTDLSCNCQTSSQQESCSHQILASASAQKAQRKNSDPQCPFSGMRSHEGHQGSEACIMM